ncbi:MAG: metallophosphoesterase [Actinomycetota bacterium]|nr:metallophosphoesterase [Actinomycetota bacterium]
MRRARVLFVAIVALAACSTTPPRATRTPSATPTAESAGLDATFVVMGDWGAGTSAQASIADRMCTVHQRSPFHVVVTTGDNFYNPDGGATGTNFFEPERCLIDLGVQWRASWGNHDAGSSSTGSSLGAAHHYRWSLGGIDLFALDSNDASGAEQRAWLRTALSSSTARAKIVYFHHPPFTAGLHAPNAGVRAYWVPLFERYHVTLVLSGHNHDYEHLVEHGIDYVVTGGGGANVYPCLRAAEGLKRCSAEHHFLLVTARGDRLEVRAIRAEGSTLDRFTIAV